MLKSKFGHWLLFVIWCLVLGIYSNVYALDLTKLKTDFLNAEYESAIKEGEKILAQAKNSSGLDELYYFLGLSYLKNGNFLRASDIFEIILNEFNNSNFKGEAKLALGDSYFLRENYLKAREYYQQLLGDNQEPEFKPLVYYRMSLASAKLGDSEEAKKYLDKLKQDYPLSLETRESKDLSPTAGFYYTVQVGAFSSSASAGNLKQKLSQLGYPAYVQELSSQGETMYRVRVGKLKIRQEAEELESKLIQEGYPTKIFP